MPNASFDLRSLRADYASGAQTPATTIKTVLQRIAAVGDDGVWISRFPDAALFEAAARLSASGSEREPSWPWSWPRPPP